MQNHPNRGANLLFGLLAIALAVLLASCTPKIHVDLLNESGGPIRVGDTIQSRTVFVTVTNCARITLHGGNPLIVRSGDVERKYSVNSLPEKCVRSTPHGLVVSVALGGDHKLYLLDPSEQVPASRLDPQPAPFPLSPKD